MKVELQVIDCETNSNRVALNLPAVIGRGEDADLVIAHPEVSRQHCRIFWYQNAVHVQDLRSLNGTIISGRRIHNSESIILPDETFIVGPVQFRITYSRQESSSSEISNSTSRRMRSSSTNAANTPNSNVPSHAVLASGKAK